MISNLIPTRTTSTQYSNSITHTHTHQNNPTSNLVLMEKMKPIMKDLSRKVKQATLLWLEGFKEACCLHRVVFYCLRSRELMIRTGQCFLLNGFIFLGSIFVLKSVIIPTLEWILPDQCPLIDFQETCSRGNILRFHHLLRLGLVQIVYVLWFYPLYVFSFILSNIWYNDIAKYGFFATEMHGPDVKVLPSKNEPSTSDSKNHADKSTDIEGVMINIAEQAYSVLLLTVFFVEVYVTGYIPYIGKFLNFLLLSWMYAYYCFEYKWNLSGRSLNRRLDFFETNWAFFAGFGNPCALAIFLFSPLVSFGVMAILYPLFVLTATGSNADKVIDSRTEWRDLGLGRLPVFSLADYLS
ncbi:protein EI24 homolog isoform X2 [Apium graveolens]